MKTRTALLYDDLTRSIIAAFFEVYNILGYGLLESVYAAALDEELRGRGHHVQREVWVDVFYKGVPVKRQRIDRIVDGKVVIEIKASALLPPYAERQLLTCLKATPLEVGLLLHFGPTPEFHRLVSSNRGQLNTAKNEDVPRIHADGADGGG